MATSGEQYILRMIVDVQNDAALKQLTKDIKSSGTSLATTNRSMNQTARGSRQLGYAFQSAGFQISDFAVQVNGGVSATRALSQQLPQLLSGFNILNPAFALTTAALATLAASLPAIVGYFKEATGAAKPLKDTLEETGDIVGRVTGTFNTIDFSGWNKAFDEATDSTQRLYLSLLNIDQIEAQRQIAAIRESIQAEVEQNQRLSLGQRAVRANAGANEGLVVRDLVAEQERLTQGFRSANLQEAFGIDQQTAATVENVMQSFSQGLIDVQELASIMITLAGNTEEASSQFFGFARQLAEAQSAQQKLLQIEQQRAAAQEALRTGGRLSPEDDPSGTSGGSRNRVVSVTPEEARIRADIEAYGRLLDAREKERQSLVQEAEAYEFSLLPAAERYRIELEALNAATKAYGLTEAQSASLTDQLTEKYRQQADAIIETQEQMSAAQQFAQTAFSSFDRNFQSFVDGIARGTTDVKDLFKRMAAAIITDLGRIYATQLLTGLVFGGNVTQGSTAGIPTSLNPSAFQAKGGVWENGVQAFAQGGVVSSPTIFPMARGFGLMGEAGAEAIMPLGRMSNGDLGVQGQPMNVTINNNAGVEVTATQGEGGLTIDIVRAVIAGDIARGGNPVASAISGSFGLQRAGV